MNNESGYNNLLILAMSFALSTVAFIASNSHDEVPTKAIWMDEVPTKVIWMDEVEIRPDFEVLEFEDYVIVAQANEEDDGDTDGIDWRRNAEFWCATHPDECEVELLDIDEDDEMGC